MARGVNNRSCKPDRHRDISIPLRCIITRFDGGCKNEPIEVHYVYSRIFECSTVSEEILALGLRHRWGITWGKYVRRGAI